MQQRKLDIFIGLPCYGGNGSYKTMQPEIGDWLVTTVLKMKADQRIGSIYRKIYADTPAPLIRNRIVQDARSQGCDALLMIDNDQLPEMYLGQPGAKPFWDTSFDFLYDHYDRGPVVIATPYCGPPPNECPYVFQWRSNASDNPDDEFKLEMYTREEVAHMGGIYPVAALPTGVILYDMRCFDLIEPPYFYYEYKDKFQSEKASTEDVANTRDISIAGQIKLGYNPVFANFDAWWGHVKPKVVGKPSLLSVSQIAEKMRAAVLRNQPAGEQQVHVHADPYAHGPAQHVPRFDTTIPLPDDAAEFGRDVVDRSASIEINGRS